MTKKTILLCIVIFVFTLTLPLHAKININLQEKKSASWPTTQDTQLKMRKVVTKTYHLKYIKPDDLVKATRFYIIDSTSYKNTITVKIYENKIQEFEQLLQKFDVEKKSLLFKVYTIVASNEPEESEKIENKGLKNVLDELRNLWNFKSYQIDSPSFLTVKEASGHNQFRLVSNTAFNLRIGPSNVTGEKHDDRVVAIDFIHLAQFSLDKEHTLIASNGVTLKENGYLVVGVSGFFGRKGKALILVISVEIKD
jgi:hypothetical protein